MCRSLRISRTASMRIRSPRGSSTYRSGCERRSTRACPPSSSEAKATAVARLPTPAGPWKRYACAGPSASAAASRRFASPCSGRLSKAVKDLAPDLVRWAAAVDGDDPVGKELRDLAVGAVDARAEVVVLALDPVPARRHPARGELRVDKEQVRAIREHSARRVQVELQDALEAEAARDPLVGERGVEVAVADDVRPAGERRRDHGLDELGAGRGKERRLGPRGHVALVQEHLADAFTELGSARLAREDDLTAVRRESLRE